MTSSPNVRLCDIVGNCGKYQITIIMINIAASLFNGIMRVIIELLAPTVNLYWDWEASDPNKTIFKSLECKMDDILQHNITSNMSNSSSKLIYDSQYAKRTVTEEFNLICERSWLVSFTNTMLLIGHCFGCVIFSRLSEIHGRTKCTIWIALACLVSNILILFSQGYVMFVLAVTVYGATGGTLMFFIFFQVLEMSSSSWSEYAGAFTKTGALLGQTLLVGIAWLLEDWFYTQVFHTILSALFLVSLYFAEESPVWLTVRRRYEEAENALTRIVVKNGLDLQLAVPKIQKYLDEMKHFYETQSTGEKGKFKDLFKNRVIAFYTFATSALRTLVNFMYLNLIMNAETFGSGLYVDLTLSNLLALVCYIIATVLLTKFSIRNQQIFLCLCGGISCAIYPFLYEISVARSVLIGLGRCFISPVANFLLVYSSQITPTSVRGILTGFVSAVSGIITPLSPFTKELGQLTAEYVPFILLAVCGFISAALFMFLPETRGKELTHTVDELVKKN